MTIPDVFLARIDQLEPLPVAMQRLIALLSDEDVSLFDVADIVELDPAIASNVLRAANSALFGGKIETMSLRDAISRLGIGVLTQIVMGNRLRETMIDAPTYDLTREELWLHGAVSSLAAKEIMKRADNEIPSLAPVAALLHDIGKVIMARDANIDLHALWRLAQLEEIPFVEAERRLFGVHHGQIGAQIARFWNFPDDICDAIEYHHDAPIANPSPMIDTVVLSNFVAKTVGIGIGAEGMNLRVDYDCVDRLKVDPDEFCEICAAVLNKLEDLKATFA